MDLRAPQTEIVAQLNGAFAGTAFTASEIPDAADYPKAVPNPLVYVLYTGSELVEQLSSDPVVERRKLKFNVECYSMKLYGAAGMFAMRELVEAAVLGFMPTNCERIYSAKDDAFRGEDNIWGHAYNLECFTETVQDITETIVVPSFTGLGEAVTDFSDDFTNDFS